MAGKDIIKMSQEEAKRLCVIQKALSREINQVKAAEILSLSDRQIRRIVNWKKTCKSRRHYQWRERKHYFGEMVQMDGSQHDWLEGRAPACVFMGYISDSCQLPSSPRQARPR